MNDWKLSSKELPKIGSNVEFSEDGITLEGTLDYIEKRTCILAVIASGFGYFGEGFATDGKDGFDRGLVCDPPKYWRYPK